MKTPENSIKFEELNPSVEDILMMEEQKFDDDELMKVGYDPESGDEQASGYESENDYDSASESDPAGNDCYTGNSLQYYLKQIGSIPLLTAEEELSLGKMISEGGPDADWARNKLVQANLRLVMHYAKRYLGRGIELDDLNSMGIEGLLVAARKYDYSLKYRFSTYASWWINQAIFRGIANEAGFVKIPIHVNEVINKVRKAQKALEPEKGKEPSVGEIAEYLKISEKQVMTAVRAMYNVVSLDKMVGEDGDATLEDFFPDENAEDPCETAVNNGLKEAVRKVLGRLTPKEALVLSLRYGIDTGTPMTLEEVANHPEFGVTRERIRQIESKAIRRIRCNPRMMKLLKDYAA
ncbi:MAG: RNA polymerase sigma factor RpoD/SigA [Lachnospiraceae bacterium]|nr:RNA polymerase sigma factor RpoD/SigA [Lachnospiraceae bacterium]